MTPGDTPFENAQFLLFLCAVIQAVDDYQDLLRISVADAGNDHRLGANEAPPAVVSMFLGDELTAILDAIENNTAYCQTEKTQFKLGVHFLPKFPKDTTDRNRTSPFAFTGNKFEFRMLGSSSSIACSNIMINTAVAESLRQYADILENAENFETELNTLIKSVIKKHKRIIFNGNGYDDEWIKEATEKRGLLNYKTTPDALVHYADEKNLELFRIHKIFSEAEVNSRCEIILENYCKTIRIEALTMIEMARKEIIPAVEEYIGRLASTANAKRAFVATVDCSVEEKLVVKLSELVVGMYAKCDDLEARLADIKRDADVAKLAFAYKDNVIGEMQTLRELADEAEKYTADTVWPFPTYAELLFGVQ